MTKEDILRSALVDQLTTKNYNMRGRRITNAAASKDPNDYVIKSELDTAISKSIDFTSNILKFFKTYVGTVLVYGLYTFQKAVSFANDVTIAGTTSLTNLLLDSGAGPTDSQLKASANAAGALELLSYSADNQQILIDCSWDSGSLLAKAATTFRINKSSGKLHIYCATGQTPGNTVSGEFTIFELDSADKLTIGRAASSIGFFAGTPATKQTLSAYTSSNRSASFTSTPGSLAAAATLVDLNVLRASYETLRIAHDDLRTKLQTTTLIG